MYKIKKLASYFGALSIALLKGNKKINARGVNHLLYYPEENLIYNRIPKSGNSTVSLFLYDSLTKKNNNYSKKKPILKQNLEL